MAPIRALPDPDNPELAQFHARPRGGGTLRAARGPRNPRIPLRSAISGGGWGPRRLDRAAAPGAPGASRPATAPPPASRLPWASTRTAHEEPTLADLPGTDLGTAFVAAFGAVAAGATIDVVRAPGRVNLIGEHTDYNQGLVLPVAIDLEIRIARRPRPDRRVRLALVADGSVGELDLDRIGPPTRGWIDYVAGTAREMAAAGLATAGFDGVLASTIPIASGLSSSAALELASVWALSPLRRPGRGAARGGPDLPAGGEHLRRRPVRAHGPVRVGRAGSPVRPSSSTAARSNITPCRCPRASPSWSPTRGCRAPWAPPSTTRGAPTASAPWRPSRPWSRGSARCATSTPRCSSATKPGSILSRCGGRAHRRGERAGARDRGRAARR